MICIGAVAVDEQVSRKLMNKKHCEHVTDALQQIEENCGQVSILCVALAHLPYLCVTCINKITSTTLRCSGFRVHKDLVL